MIFRPTLCPCLTSVCACSCSTAILKPQSDLFRILNSFLALLLTYSQLLCSSINSNWSSFLDNKLNAGQVPPFSSSIRWILDSKCALVYLCLLLRCHHTAIAPVSSHYISLCFLLASGKTTEFFQMKHIKVLNNAFLNIVELQCEAVQLVIKTQIPSVASYQEHDQILKV